MKILIVEDDAVNLDMLTRRLKRRGFVTHEAMDGLDALQMALSVEPDIILMDLSLPGIDGWEAIRRLKRDEATRKIPVIALTAHAMSEDRGRALAAGSDDFDNKPIDLDRLLEKIHALAGGGASRS